MKKLLNSLPLKRASPPQVPTHRVPVLVLGQGRDLGLGDALLEAQHFEGQDLGQARGAASASMTSITTERILFFMDGI